MLTIADDVQAAPWVVSTFTVEQKTDYGRNYLRFHLEALRRSKTLRIELYLPITISLVLVLLSFLFGDFQTQIGVKMFALFVQFLSFQMLVQRSLELGHGVSSSVPKICKLGAVRFQACDLGGSKHCVLVA